MKNCLVIIILTLINPAHGQTSDVFDLAAKYNKKKHQVVNLQSKKRKILAEIYSIEKETNKIVVQKSELNEKKMKLDVSLNKISKKVIATEALLIEMTPELTERMAFVEQINNLPWFYTFLTSQSVMDLDHLFETASKINNSQADQVLQFTALISELELQKKALTRTAREIVFLKKDITKKEKTIEKNQVSKKKILSNLEKTIKNEKRRLKSIKGSGKRALALSEFKDLDMLFGADFFDKKGQLPHPLQSPISHGFGLNRGLSQDLVDLIHKGNFYSTKKETEVKGVTSGRVRYSNKVAGFGHVVVVDHGGHYYTTYGNLKKTFVKKNQIIEVGEVLGLTGHNHLQLKTGLYFEIRHFSQPQNPEAWLQPRKGHLATL